MAKIGRYHVVFRVDQRTTSGGGMDYGTGMAIEKAFLSLGTFDDFLKLEHAILNGLKEYPMANARAMMVDYILIVDNETLGTYAFNYIAGDEKGMSKKLRELGLMARDTPRFRLSFDVPKIGRESAVNLNTFEEFKTEINKARAVAGTEATCFGIIDLSELDDGGSLFLGAEFITKDLFYLFTYSKFPNHCSLDFHCAFDRKSFLDAHDVKSMSIKDLYAPTDNRLIITSDGSSIGRTVFKYADLIRVLDSSQRTTPTMWNMPK